MSQPDIRVKITTDSTSDLGAEIHSKHDIPVMPLYVNFGEDSYRDGINVDGDMIFRYFEQTGELAKTAAASVDEYKEFFSRHRAEGVQIVHIGIGAHFSASYEFALAAAEAIGGVHVADSKSLSSGVGLLVLLAKSMADAGKSAAEIVSAVEAAREKVSASFVIDTMDFLFKGGRCSALAAFGANLLQIKPSIKVIDGEMKVGKKYRGSTLKALMQYVDDTLANTADIDASRLYITHTGCGDGIIQAVRDKVAEHIRFDEIIVSRAGSTITCHAGPNTLGILFFHK